MIKAYSDAFVLHDRSAIDNEEVEVGTDSNQGERHRSEVRPTENSCLNSNIIVEISAKNSL